MGRTGTFIVIDNILEQIEKEQVVDIPGAITKIRQKRMKMVQTHVSITLSYHCYIIKYLYVQDQFTFIHDAILESVTCGDTQISATNLRSTIMKLGKKAGFQHQMKVRNTRHCMLGQVPFGSISKPAQLDQDHGMQLLYKLVVSVCVCKYKTEA